MARIRLHQLRHQLAKLLMPIRVPLARLHYLAPMRLRFQGVFANRDAAVAAVPSKYTVGYDNDNVVDLNFDWMCKVAPWDYPVILWLNKLLPDNPRLLDAGGHMGTKYRAFQPYIDLSAVDWTIYDVPAITRAGETRAREEGLTSLRFISDLEGCDTPDILLASGLLQYLDMPLEALFKQLPQPPKHVILNKVALHDRDTLFTLENFYSGLVPFQIRNESAFRKELEKLGYRIVDEWEIPDLTHNIPTHPEVGSFINKGFYLTRI